jgi:hypothetical protein
MFSSGRRLEYPALVGVRITYLEKFWDFEGEAELGHQ